MDRAYLKKSILFCLFDSVRFYSLVFSLSNDIILGLDSDYIVSEGRCGVR